MIEIYRGDSKTIKVSVTNNDAPFDLTGYTARLKAKRSIKDAVPALEIDSEPITSPELGVLVIKLQPSQTEALSPGSYIYDVEIRRGTDATLEVHTVVMDEMVVLGELG